MSEPLTLMAVHAHPDDEASSGGILAAYADQGIQTVVVTCTNGEYGDAPGGIKPGQPGHDPEAVARQRLAELDQSASILKVSDLETLGYHDSGMEEWDYKSSPEAFSNVPLATVAGRIGELITKYRPQVLVTYDDAGRLPAPGPRAREPVGPGGGQGDRHPGEGVPVHHEGLQLAEDLGRAARGGRGGARTGTRPRTRSAAQRALESEERITTTVDIRPVLERKRAALFAHGSQINDSWFSKIPPEVAEQAFGYEYFIRMADTTGAPVPEDDLFAGLRTGA